ncbi:hypothetical protein XELAEV_18032369mg [Xenopus laevis]|uniref:Uncharacterized protein n=1 Tax=Xenopus laevis TaxID=8355 RepID=A0A974CQ23_XENLA|nr:hypothetical protein XELAEV_18032369mg [Xenopus laevis]
MFLPNIETSHWICFYHTRSRIGRHLLALSMIVFDEVLQQIHAFLSLDFIHFNQILPKQKRRALLIITRCRPGIQAELCVRNLPFQAEQLIE